MPSYHPTKSRESIELSQPSRSAASSAWTMDATTPANEHANLIQPPTKNPVNTQISEQNNRTFQLRRFYLRPAVGIITPIVVTGFYVYIAWIYLQPKSADPELPIHVGKEAQWVYYSWFVVGTIGINLSQYGLQGVEASMLMERRWGAENALQLMMHSDATWSGPGGWLKIFRKMWYLVGRKRRGAEFKDDLRPSGLWWLLAALSAMIFIALPLSGLTMELADGFKLREGSNPIVIGRDYWTINQRLDADVGELTRYFWKRGTPATIPGAGIVYTAPAVDRSKHSFLAKLPNSLPVEDGIPELFLVPQAEEPFQGETWGLRLQYNCSVVADRSELKIVGREIDSGKEASFYNFLNQLNKFGNKSETRNLMQEDVQGASIYTLPLVKGFDIFRFPTFLQVGISDMEGLTVGPVDTLDEEFQPVRQARYRYFNGSQGLLDFKEYDRTNTLEVLLFQHLGDVPTKHRDLMKDYKPVNGLDGVYTLPSSPMASGRGVPMPMTAVGVRCTSSSTPGNAKIDAGTSTFTDFQKTATFPGTLSPDDYRVRLAFGVHPFPFGPLSVLLPNPSEDVKSNAIGDIFDSIRTGWSSFSSLVLAREGATRIPFAYDSTPAYPPFDAEKLRRSMLSLYALYARTMMYDSAVSDTSNAGMLPNQTIQTSDTRRWNISDPDARYFHAFQNLNVTATVPGKILVRGLLPWQVIIAMLAAWCLFSIVLGVLYGFRRRWSDTLDAFSMFRFGADFRDELENHADFPDTRDFERSGHTLEAIPGLIGDSRPFSTPGKISLVWRRDYVPGVKAKRFKA
ncbi:hypothetical protein BJ508DRAFT_235786 [Ascobolus immersus RN42]|uniref:Uncharacterized protein n=1 Tax=Ascobolus immersus RN42 TaxID=1160509 RepID=A0A3N4IFK4_ASCIM|nr:hypothetical protein BJ508DRAFT_235786 [Ascobolus immersus RN42]